MTIIIRHPKVTDLPALNDLVLRSKQSNGYDDAFMEACRDELRLEPADLTSGFWLAENGPIWGCCCLQADQGRLQGEVSLFFVDPLHQRQGVGGKLWRKILWQARQLQLRELFLDADPFAVGFYQGLGFTVIGQKPSGSISGRMLPHMALRI